MCAAPAFPYTNLRSRGVETDFRSIFEHCPLPAARCDRQGIILQMNSAFEQVLNGKKDQSGVSRVGEVVARADRETPDRQTTDRDTTHRENRDRETTDRLFRQVLQGERTAVQIEKGQSNRGWTMWRVAGREDDPHGALLVGRSDVDTVAQEDLLQAQRWEVVGRLTGGVVHDFNNLLTGVMLYCDLFLANLETGERRLRRYAEEIRGAVGQASLLIRQLLVFARPKSSQVRPTCLNQVAETVRNLLGSLIGDNIELELRLDPHLDLVEMDWAQAEQMLLNLILNARDALPKGGRIVVETRNSKLERVSNAGRPLTETLLVPFVLLAVSDNGCGMDAATRLHLFEPFYTTKAEGTGLGLITTRSIVTDNRGLIHVESELGRGTRVMILLPQSSPVSNPPHLAVATSESPTTFQEVKKEPHL